MTSTGNTPAVATSPGSPPSVEGLGDRLPRLEKHAGYVESMTRLPGCKPWLDEHLEDLESVIRALPWLLDRAREAETSRLRMEAAHEDLVAANTDLAAAYRQVSALTAERDRMAEALKPLIRAGYIMSEAHLSGFKLTLGFNTREEVDAAHIAVTIHARQALQSDGRGE